jgi:hypothetical protein
VAYSHRILAAEEAYSHRILAAEEAYSHRESGGEEVSLDRGLVDEESLHLPVVLYPV